MTFEDWDDLIYGIERGECILFLGQDLPMGNSAAERPVPTRDLALRFLKGLGAGAAAGPNTDSGTLAQVAQRFLAEKDEVSLEREVERWHGALQGQGSTLHDNLAALPFRLIVTSSHDPLMQDALRRAGKVPEVGVSRFAAPAHGLRDASILERWPQ